MKVWTKLELISKLHSLGAKIKGNYVRRKDIHKNINKLIGENWADKFRKKTENEDESALEYVEGRDVKGTEPAEKDMVRLQDIKKKASGDPNKAIQLVRNMANAIGRGSSGGSKEKAERRAKAAEKVFPGEFGKMLANIFREVA